MFYYLLDKEDNNKIIEANKSREALISLCNWLPEYSEEDILTTEEELINTPVGWVRAEDYVPEEVEKEEFERAVLDAEKQAMAEEAERQREQADIMNSMITNDFQNMLDELHNEFSTVSEISNANLNEIANANVAIDKLQHQVDKIRRALVVINTKSDDLSYKIVGHDELKEMYIKKISELIKNACYDIIVDYYPLYKQINLSLMDKDDEERVKFIAYRDFLTKQCHEFIEELKNTEIGDESMIHTLDTYYNDEAQADHGQSILFNLDFNYKFIYEPSEVFKILEEGA